MAARRRRADGGATCASRRCRARASGAGTAARRGKPENRAPAMRAPGRGLAGARLALLEVTTVLAPVIEAYREPQPERAEEVAAEHVERPVLAQIDARD